MDMALPRLNVEQTLKLLNDWYERREGWYKVDRMFEYCEDESIHILALEGVDVWLHSTADDSIIHPEVWEFIELRNQESKPDVILAVTNQHEHGDSVSAAIHLVHFFILGNKPYDFDGLVLTMCEKKVVDQWREKVLRYDLAGLISRYHI
jgi:hypothetical protein